MALALAATGVRGIVGAYFTDGVVRLSYHWIGVISAGAAWIAVGFWQDWRLAEVVSFTALGFGGLAVAVSGLLVFWRLRVDSGFMWGGLATVGVVVAGFANLSRGALPRIDGPWLAFGFAMLVVAFELAAARLGRALRVASPLAAGVAWITLVDGLGWDRAEFVFSTSLVFGGLALVVGGFARFWRLQRLSALRWGSLAAVAVTLAALLTVDPNLDPLWGPGVAVGLVLLAVGFELAARTVDETLRYLSVAATGAAWITLVDGLGWDRAEFVFSTSLVFGGLALVVGGFARFWRLQRLSALRWGSLAAVAVTLAALLTVDPNLDPLWGPGVAVGLVLLAVGFELAARTVDETLRYLSVAATGAAWITLVDGLGWDETLAVALSTAVFGTLVVAIVEVLRVRTREHAEVQVSVPSLHVFRAWAALGGAGVLTAALVGVRLGETTMAIWAVVGAGVLTFSSARGAGPLRFAWLREASSVAGLAAVTLLAIGTDVADARLAIGVVGIAVLATFLSLSLWRRLPDSIWLRPLVVLASAANLEAAVFAVQSLPARGLVVAVLLSIGVQALAMGITLNRPVLLASGPPVIGAAFILMISENVGGSAQWYTVPIGLVLLTEVQILRKVLRDSAADVNGREVIMLEWLGVGLLGAPPLVEMFTTGIGFGFVAFGAAALVLLWGAVTRVRRRAIAAASLATAAAVLILFAAGAGSAPDSAFFWIVAVGIGFAVMLVAALIEAYRSKKGQLMARFDQIMEGWE